MMRYTRALQHLESMMRHGFEAIFYILFILFIYKDNVRARIQWQSNWVKRHLSSPKQQQR